MLIKNGVLPGDIKVLKVFIDEYDVSQAMVSTEVYLDMLMPSWSCKVFMQDTNNLMMTLPIKQGSKLSITAETSLRSIMDDKKTFNFVIFSVTDKEFINRANIAYTIHGVSETWIKNMGARVTRPYKSMSPVDIVSKVLKEYLGGSLKDEHSANNVVDISAANQSPYNVIAQMTKIAQINTRADFLFFQTDNNSYTMKSIDKMYNEESSNFEFKMRPSKLRDSNGNINIDYCQCFTDYYFDHYNTGTNKSGGLYASTAATYDLMSQNWSANTFKFGTDSITKAWNTAWDRGNALFEEAKANITFNPTHPGMSSSGRSALDYAKEWSPSRKSSLLKLEQDNLIIQVPCGIKGWTGLGKTCEVELTSNQEIKKDSKYDEQYSGKYMITAMCFLLNRAASFTNYHLAKMGMSKPFGSFSF
jgi:hypothetical protein